MITDDEPSLMIETKPVEKKKIRRWISIIINLIILGAALFFSIRFFNDNGHKKIEKEMIAAAKTYIEKNLDKFSQEVYIDAGKLGFITPGDCSGLSGVLYDGETITPYLSCSEYESDLESNETNKKYITLNGSGIVVLLKGMKYEEPGYSSEQEISVFGTVGEDEGVYTIYYNDDINQKIVQRKVVIIDNNSLINQFPNLTVSGTKEKFVILNNLYENDETSAKDDIDGDISYKIKRLGNVNVNLIGDYHFSYMINNSRGYRVYVERVAKVVEHLFDLDIKTDYEPKNNTKNSVVITMKVTGERFDRIVLPDDTTSSNKEITYEVSANGKYKFKVYDKAGLFEEKEIVIDNIDRDLPEGTCKTMAYAGRSKTVVEATSLRGIASYEYIVDGISSGETQNTFYETSSKPTKVSVKLKDVVGSNNEIECTITEPQVYTDSTGKNCLDGYICYIQFNYKSEKYPYCSMTTENSCGTISRNGCSITSTTIAIAGFEVRNKIGQIYNPYTVWEDLYQINKKTGYCDAACSSWTRIRGALKNAGLTPADKPVRITRDQSSLQPLFEHLNKGYPAIVHAGKGPYTKGGHYMILLGIRSSDNYVFLSDPAMWSGTYETTYEGKNYYADTYVSIDDLISGKVDDYLLVGPAGYVW